MRSSSAAAAASIDTILAGLIDSDGDPVPEADEVVTTGQAAALLGVSRPTLVAWLEAGHIPYHRSGSHRRVPRSHVLTYLEERRQSNEA